MSKALICVFLVFVFHDYSQAQNHDSLREMCESILVDSMSRKWDEKPTEYRIDGKASLLPITKSQPLLLAALAESNSMQTRIAAAAILQSKTGNKFRNEIESAFTRADGTRPSESELPQMQFPLDDRLEHPVLADKLSEQCQLELIQRSIIRMKLGIEPGRTRVLRWAKDPLHQIETGEWICEMIHLAPVKEPGVCPICLQFRTEDESKLVPATRGRNINEWEAKLAAIRAVQDLGGQVSEMAKAMVVSHAPPAIRMRAAALWASENREDALPHLKIFVDYRNGREYGTPIRFLTAIEMAKFEPQICLPILKEGVAKGWGDPDDRRQAYRLLIRLGESDHLDSLKKRLASEPTSKNEALEQILAVVLIGEFGDENDIEILATFLGSEFKTEAAGAILKILARKEKRK